MAVLYLQSSLIYLTFVIVASAIDTNDQEVSFKATKDYPFEVRTHPEIIYDPRYFEVAKRLT